MTKYLLVFDDYPLATENQLFLLNLRKAFQKADVVIQEEKNVHSLTQALQSRAYAAIILDVMAAFPAAPELEAVTGIEVLRRCRNGQYGPSNQQAAFFMRSARGEIHIHEEATKLGSLGWFKPGSDDSELISVLKERLRPS